MAKGIAVVIGVRKPFNACGALQEALGAEEAAAALAELLAQLPGYEPPTRRLGPAATVDAVRAAIHQASQDAEPGDLAVVAFFGHGCNRHPAAEYDGVAESWCLADGFLLDLEQLALLREFGPEVRVHVLLDTCYAGGMFSRDEAARDEWKARLAERYAEVRTRYLPQEGDPPPQINARTFVLASAEATQLSEAGIFWGCFESIWASGPPPTLQALTDHLADCVWAASNQQQRPTSFVLGPPPTLELDAPFQV